MLELTQQQRNELKQTTGKEIRIADPETGHEYVLLRAEVYERWRRLVYDEGDWTPEEQLHLLAESGKRAGWDDPAMHVYDNYDENRNNGRNRSSALQPKGLAHESPGHRPGFGQRGTR